MVRQKPTFIFSDQDCRLPSWLFLIFVQRSTFSWWGFSPPKKRGIEIHAETSNKILGFLWPPAQSEKSPKYHRASLIAGTAGIDCSICFAHFVTYHRYFSICLLIRHDQSVSPCFNVFINLFAYCPSILPPTRLFNAQSLNHSIIFNPCIHPSLPQSIQHSINQPSKQLIGGFKHERYFP